MSITMRRSTAVTRIAVVVVAVAGLLAGCSGSTAASAPPSAPSSAPTDGPRGGFAGGDPALLQQIQDCLTAAGIATPTGRPSGATTGRPSGAPTGRPTGRPSGSPPGGGRGAFADPKTQAALKACGITLPTRPADDGFPTAAPTA
ncbi:MAG: hypothetical protein ACOH2F_08375 [Cellulomonas sp.]